MRLTFDAQNAGRNHGLNNCPRKPCIFSSQAVGNRWTKLFPQLKRLNGEFTPASLIDLPYFLDRMGRSNLISSPRRKPRKRARLTKSRPQAVSVVPQLEPGAPSDLELMKAIQAEDADALSQLYDRYNGILKALILRVIHNEAEADDLLQEIFMEIWNQAKNFSSQKGKPLGWMVTLARRRAIDGLRKKQAYARAEERLQNETEQQPDAWIHNATEEEIVLSDTRGLIRKVIAGLPPAQQQAIDLAFFRGMSQREIAAKTNTPLGTVKTRLELGLKKIYDGLKELRDEL
jgi:RNA polymerase sigma-70 factor, ECF subfamily